jgi:hypothetical protein
MLPANPPLPTPRYFPFQTDAGSHTSNSMCESLVGWITPCTRQKAGRAFQAASAGPFGGAPGGVKAPAATTWAAVKVVFAISTGVDKGKVKESDGWAQRLLTRSRWTRFSTRLLCPAPEGIEAAINHRALRIAAQSPDWGVTREPIDEPRDQRPQWPKIRKKR